MKMTKTFALVAALSLAPAMAFAQAPAKAKATAAKKADATHSTSGIVKTSDSTSLVIAKSAKDAKTTSFVVNAQTVTKGDLAPGARVSVRYRSEGGQNIATAITASAKKEAKPVKKTAAKASKAPKANK